MNKEDLKKLEDLFLENPLEITISSPEKGEKYLRVKARPVIIKDKPGYQFEEFTKTQAFHTNIPEEESKKFFISLLESRFKQALVKFADHTSQILVSKKGNVTIINKKAATEVPSMLAAHNRTKNYLLSDGTFVPFLGELGVMTKDGRVKKEKYDKFRQINRFLEFISDIYPELPKEREITILDFGCGKSYLTFAIYHFLKIMKGMEVKIIGLDLKTEVINNCNALAKKLGYTDLTFLNGNIAEYNELKKADMVVTLHACDTATDYALLKAINLDAKVILSVPCCQHEMNKTIKSSSLSPIFKYGLIKERTAALFTDAIRANILEACGYKTQILEFIDMEHTPKNILIRAVKTGKRSEDALVQVGDTLKVIGGTSTLYRELTQ
ncbi:MAG: SAM-dependent methyltransferase [Lachnospiraceae bacterium]|nr:SAM-dependent methyltransferase [Lachnospiraceae bacterium]